MGNRQLIGNNAVGGHIGFGNFSIPNKYVVQRLLHGFHSKGTGGDRLYVERGYGVMEGFAIFRNDSAALDIRLGTDAGLRNAGIKADSLVVDEVTVGSAAAGHAAILVDGNKVVGAEIFLAVYLFQFEEHGIVDLAAADRGRAQIQNTGAGAVGQIVELLFLLVKNLDLDMRQGIADGSIFTFGRGNNASTANLGQAVTVSAPHIGAVCLQEFIVFLLLFRGNAGTT